jgi:hypothetical protein
MTHALLQWLCGGSRRSANVKRSSGHTVKQKAWLQVEILEERTVPTGTWTTLANPFPANGGGAQLALLLSDGTVMVQAGGGNASSAWYKLTPDSTGSYINGTWSRLASMHAARLYFTSDILTDGRVFVEGGEYTGPNSAQTNINTGEVYDPVANTWTNIPNFPEPYFGDAPSEVLPNGQVLAGYKAGPQTYLYDPTRNLWVPTQVNPYDDDSFEETWLKLPDDSILSYDNLLPVNTNTFEAQRYIPSKGQWIDASTLDPNNPPSLLTNVTVGDQIGPALLLPNGNAIFFGGNGNTAIYSPSTNTWTAGPAEPTRTINGKPTQLVMADGPAAMMPNGDALIALSPEGTNTDGSFYNFPSPTWIYEFNPATNTYTDVTPSNIHLNETSSNTTMLVLPTGQVVLLNYTRQIDVFTPDGGPNPAWQPTISNVTDNGNDVFTLTGTQLNGISEGANYGSDAEMASNYPIIRLTDASGNVSFARTFNWSSTGVATGSTPESLQFTLPTADAPGPYLVSVIANGIASAPVLDVLMGTLNTNLALQVNANDPGSLDVLSSGSLLAELPMSSFSAVIVTGSNTDNTIAIQSTGSGAPLTVNEGTGHDTVSVGDGDLDAIQGPLTVNGGVTDSLLLNDSSFISPRTFTVTASTVAWGGPTLDYSGVGSVTLQGGTGGNTFTVLATPVSTVLSIVGHGSGDTLVGSNASNLFALLGANMGVLFGSAYGNSVLFSQIGNLIAGTGGDTFQFAAGASLTGNITGSGKDTLDYSNYSSNVIVDLQISFATGVGGSVRGITTVDGGSGDGGGVYNLLIGSGGDTLVGGLAVRNILVAGPNASTLISGDGQDLLIGGSTAYDTQAGLTSWKRIAAFWASGASYATRVARLTSGTGEPLLDASVVLGNGGGHTFVGYGGLALLYIDGMDNIGLFDPNSQQVAITP